MTGDDYVASITARDPDLRARAEFLQLAMNLAAPGSSIFDFGAGPGLDAKHYAQHGFQVLTYDVDPQMCSYLRSFCRDEIARQQVVPWMEFQRDDGEGSAPPAGIDIGLVTANFAPFNLIDEPCAYFKKFHQIIGARGKLLLSVLNPYFLGDMKYAWWWRNTLRLMLRGEYSVAGGGGPIYRRTPQCFKGWAQPYFALRAVMRGLPGEAYRRGLLRGPCLATSQYLFLLFERCP
jgi:SAM-dependent methyltransferase